MTGTPAWNDPALTRACLYAKAALGLERPAGERLLPEDDDQVEATAEDIEVDVSEQADDGGGDSGEAQRDGRSSRSAIEGEALALLVVASTTSPDHFYYQDVVNGQIYSELPEAPETWVAVPVEGHGPRAYFWDSRTGVTSWNLPARAPAALHSFDVARMPPGEVLRQWVEDIPEEVFHGIQVCAANLLHTAVHVTWRCPIHADGEDPTDDMSLGPEVVARSVDLTLEYCRHFARTPPSQAALIPLLLATASARGRSSHLLHSVLQWAEYLSMNAEEDPQLPLGKFYGCLQVAISDIAVELVALTGDAAGAVVLLARNFRLVEIPERVNVCSMTLVVLTSTQQPLDVPMFPQRAFAARGVPTEVIARVRDFAASPEEADINFVATYCSSEGLEGINGIVDPNLVSALWLSACLWSPTAAAIAVEGFVAHTRLYPGKHFNLVSMHFYQVAICLSSRGPTEPMHRARLASAVLAGAEAFFTRLDAPLRPALAPGVRELCGALRDEAVHGAGLLASLEAAVSTAEAAN